MAITPEQANELTDAQCAALERAEARIDEEIAYQWKLGVGRDGNPGDIIACPGYLSPQLMNELIQRYEAAGWNVRLRKAQGQRDEDALYFTPKGETG